MTKDFYMINQSVNSANRLPQVLSEILSLEAWHIPAEDESQYKICVDVSFKEGRLGGEADAKATFKLALKYAELVVILSDTEPAEIIPASVSRDTQAMLGERKIVSSANVSGDVGGNASMDVSSTNLAAKLRIQTKRNSSNSRDRVETIAQLIKGIRVRHFRDNERNHCWELQPEIGKALSDRPWEPNATPRMVIQDNRKSVKNDLPITIKIVVKCKREDLEIMDIQLKSLEDRALFSALGNKKNKLIAAEALIRNKLLEHGLNAENLRDRFSAIEVGFEVLEIM